MNPSTIKKTHSRPSSPNSESKSPPIEKQVKPNEPNSFFNAITKKEKETKMIEEKNTLCINNNNNNNKSYYFKVGEQKEPVFEEEKEKETTEKQPPNKNKLCFKRLGAKTNFNSPDKLIQERLTLQHNLSNDDIRATRDYAKDIQSSFKSKVVGANIMTEKDYNKCNTLVVMPTIVVTTKQGTIITHDYHVQYIENNLPSIETLTKDEAKNADIPILSHKLFDLQLNNDLKKFQDAVTTILNECKDNNKELTAQFINLIKNNFDFCFHFGLINNLNDILDLKMTSLEQPTLDNNAVKTQCFEILQNLSIDLDSKTEKQTSQVTELQTKLTKISKGFTEEEIVTMIAPIRGHSETYLFNALTNGYIAKNVNIEIQQDLKEPIAEIEIDLLVQSDKEACSICSVLMPTITRLMEQYIRDDLNIGPSIKVRTKLRYTFNSPSGNDLTSHIKNDDVQINDLSNGSSSALFLTHQNSNKNSNILQDKNITTSNSKEFSENCTIFENSNKSTADTTDPITKPAEPSKDSKVKDHEKIAIFASIGLLAKIKNLMTSKNFLNERSKYENLVYVGQKLGAFVKDQNNNNKKGNNKKGN